MNVKNILLSLLAASFLVACNNKTEDENLAETIEPAQQQALEQQKITAQNIFTSVPGPEELTSLVTATNTDYDVNLLNNPDNLKRYTTDNLKALNLGVYGGDMVYANVYEQSQESMIYLKCVNNLCRALGITGAFDDKTAERLEANKENKDSLLTIVSGSFNNADKFLRDNQRPGTSSLMVAGGWIEGLYLSAKVVEKSKNKRMVQKMSQQKQSLDDLITLLDNAHLPDDVSFVAAGLKDLKASYAKIEANAAMSDDIFKEVDDRVTQLHEKIIGN